MLCVSLVGYMLTGRICISKNVEPDSPRPARSSDTVLAGSSFFAVSSPDENTNKTYHNTSSA